MHCDDLDYDVELDDPEPHPTVRLEVKPGVFADVDRGIVPLVRWLNSFPTVTTQFCCEGEDDRSTHKPYVLILCTDLLTLERICHLLSPFSTGEFDSYGDRLRFTFRFHGKDRLRQCQHWLWELDQVKVQS